MIRLPSGLAVESALKFGLGHTLLLPLVALACADRSPAATDWCVRRFRPPDGVTFEEVRHICEADDGSLWFASWGCGVARLDGADWRVLEVADGLPTNFALSVAPASGVGVWVGTEAGIVRIRDGQVTVFSPENVSLLEDAYVGCVRRMGSGEVWFGLGNGSIVACRAGGSAGELAWRRVLAPPRDGGSTVSEILEARDGAVWVGAFPRGLLRYFDGRWKSIGREEIGFARVKSIVEASDGTICVAGRGPPSVLSDGTWRRVAHLDVQELALCPDGSLFCGGQRVLGEFRLDGITPLTMPRAVGQPLIRSIFFTDRRSGWVGTKEGILQLSTPRWRNVSPSSHQSLRIGQAFHADPTTPPLTVTAENVLAEYEPQTDSWRRILRLPGSALSHQTMTAPVDGTLWIRSGKSLYEILLREKTIRREVSLPPELADESSIGLLLTRERELFAYGPAGVRRRVGDSWLRRPFLEARGRVVSMRERLDGSLLIGLPAGYERWRGDALLDAWSPPTALEEHAYTFAAESRDGRVWLGSRGLGVIVHGNRSTQTLTTRDSLLSNRVVCFHEDARGVVWLGSEHLGISSLHDGRWVHYSHADGLPNRGLVALGEYPAGRLWAAFDYDQVFRYEPTRGRPDTRITTGPGEIAAGSGGTFSFSGYDAWNDSELESLEFSWRVIDEVGTAPPSPWTPYSPAPSLKMEPLPPGTYRLEARAQDRDRNTDPIPATLRFVVLAPTWRRPEVLAPIGLLVVLAGLLAFRLARNHRLLKAHRDQLDALVRRRTEALMAASTALEDERRQLEEEQARSQRLESLGLLAGGIAHDFNNLLMAIVGNLSLARSVTGSRSRVDGLLEDAEKACSRAHELTQQLLTFAKGGAPVRRSTRADDVIRDSAMFTLRGTNAQCDIDLPDDLWALDVDAAQIGQVVQNVVLNSAQAMPSGGKVEIRVRNAFRSDLDDRRLNDLDGERYVHVRIRDSGVGIPAEDLPKVFDPYFTTKSGGNGLGLAISYSIVRRHGGAITCDSEHGRGTVFQIYLPAGADVCDNEPAPPPRETARDRGGSILVMDDEPMVRDVVSRILEDAGYSVSAASDGSEAVDLFRRASRSEAPIDLVILDLTIPGGVGGREVMKRLRAIDPGLKGIVSSGYSSDPIMGSHLDHHFCAVLPKPYQPDKLRELVGRVLSEG